MCEMSEKTLSELIGTLRRQSLGTAERDACVAVLDARIRRAEAAERAIKAWLAWCDSDDRDGTWDAFVSAVTEYAAAREAVCKLEEQT